MLTIVSLQNAHNLLNDKNLIFIKPFFRTLNIENIMNSLQEDFIEDDSLFLYCEDVNFNISHMLSIQDDINVFKVYTTPKKKDNDNVKYEFIVITILYKDAISFQNKLFSAVTMINNIIDCYLKLTKYSIFFDMRDILNVYTSKDILTNTEFKQSIFIDLLKFSTKKIFYENDKKINCIYLAINL